MIFPLLEMFFLGVAIKEDRIAPTELINSIISLSIFPFLAISLYSFKRNKIPTFIPLALTLFLFWGSTIITTLRMHAPTGSADQEFGYFMAMNLIIFLPITLLGISTCAFRWKKIGNTFQYLMIALLGIAGFIVVYNFLDILINSSAPTDIFPFYYVTKFSYRIAMLFMIGLSIGSIIKKRNALKNTITK